MQVLHLFAGQSSAAVAVHARRTAMAFPEAKHASDLDGFERPWPYDLPLSGAPSLERFRALAKAVAPAHLILSYGEGTTDLLLAKRIFGRQIAPVVHHLTAPPTPGFAARILRLLALPAATATVTLDPGRSGDAPPPELDELRAFYEGVLVKA